MGLCDRCKNFSAEYDEMRQEYDDTLIIGETKENHFCPMFDRNIPDSIYYDDADCNFFFEKGGEQQWPVNTSASSP